MDPRSRLEAMAEVADAYGYGSGCDMDMYGYGVMMGGRKPSMYNKFFAKHRKQGYSAAEIGKMWRAMKGSGARSKCTRTKQGKCRKSNSWVKCLKSQKGKKLKRAALLAACRPKSGSKRSTGKGGRRPISRLALKRALMDY